ncbi:MAG: nuclear transport factor 2 family protein [Sphingomonadaceae bacterium]|nr:nuclear transport factor 2 family protein [Sphingomonadaceae bacterium]
MRRLMFPLMLLLAATPASAQHASAEDSAAVLATVDALFAALGAKDGAAMLALTAPEGVATASFTDETGEARIVSRSWADFAGRLAAIEGTPAERAIDPHVHVDGDIAMVWTAYEFTFDGRFSHCGIDHFDLVRREGRWRVLNLTWTRRTEGCGRE